MCSDSLDFRSQHLCLVAEENFQQLSTTFAVPSKSCHEFAFVSRENFDPPTSQSAAVLPASWPPGRPCTARHGGGSGGRRAVNCVLCRVSGWVPCGGGVHYCPHGEHPPALRTHHSTHLPPSGCLQARCYGGAMLCSRVAEYSTCTAFHLLCHGTTVRVGGGHHYSKPTTPPQQTPHVDKGHT